MTAATKKKKGKSENLELGWHLRLYVAGQPPKSLAAFANLNMLTKLQHAAIPLAIAQTLTWASLYYSFPALLPSWPGALGRSKAELSGAFLRTFGSIVRFSSR